MRVLIANSDTGTCLDWWLETFRTVSRLGLGLGHSFSPPNTCSKVTSHHLRSPGSHTPEYRARC